MLPRPRLDGQVQLPAASMRFVIGTRRPVVLEMHNKRVSRPCPVKKFGRPINQPNSIRYGVRTRNERALHVHNDQRVNGRDRTLANLLHAVSHTPILMGRPT